MKSYQEILDLFGNLIITDVYDDGIKYFYELLDGMTKWGTGKEYTSVFNKLSEEDKLVITKYIKDVIRVTIFGMLSIFEETDNFKIYFETDNQQVDILKISENLKAELSIEGGWIDRFSKYKEYKSDDC